MVTRERRERWAESSHHGTTMVESFISEGWVRSSQKYATWPQWSYQPQCESHTAPRDCFLLSGSCRRFSYPLWGIEPTSRGAYSGMNRRSLSMSRWTLDRERGQRKWKALLLLTLSGAIRPADMELRYLRETTTGGHQSEPGSAADPLSQAATSI